MAVTAGAPGVLYVVATPIGNLGDISRRAEEVLRGVPTIAAEDTRRTLSLLRAMGIEGPRVISLHEHNETAATPGLLAALGRGEDVALVSDAGTPLLSDPGFELVRRCFESGFPVLPVPGPSALSAALSVCPLATVGFVFTGFLPARAGRRRARLLAAVDAGAPLVFFEAPHRLRECLEDLEQLAPGRRVFVAREMTKTFETYLCDLPGALTRQMDDAGQWRGEMVCVLEGRSGKPAAEAGADGSEAASLTGAGDAAPDAPGEPALDDIVSVAVRPLMRALCRELPTAKAARLAAELTGLPRGVLYEVALSLKSDG